MGAIWQAIWRGFAQTFGVIAGVVGFGLAAAAALGAIGAEESPAYTAPTLWEVRAPLDRWLIDGFNVLHAGILRGRDRVGWWQEEARARLLDRVAAFAPGDAEVCVVFDGSAPSAAEATRAHPRVVFAPSADDWLVREVREAPDPAAIVVVTADRQVADRARHRGARVVSPRAFLERCGSEGADA